MSLRTPSASTVVRRVRSAPRHPLTWLLLQAVVVTLVLSTTGGLEVSRVPDSGSYIRAADSASMAEALSHFRTYGYPLLVRMAQGEDSNFYVKYRLLPPVHLAVHFAAVLLWWSAVNSFTGSRWLAFAMAMPLLYGRLLKLINNLQPDFLAASLVIASLSLLLLVLDSRSLWRWAALVVAVFCCYQMRPAGVFLVALIPVLGGVLALCVRRAGRRKTLRLAIGLAAATAAPYLAFCGLRWFTVGHFGLVSFGGANLAGVASCMIDSAAVARLPEEHQELARRVVRKRQSMNLAAMTLRDDPEPWFEQYSNNIWHVSLEVVKALTKREQRRADRAGVSLPDQRPKRVIWNEHLTGFSHAVIRARPLLYLKWIGAAIRYGLRQLASTPWIVWPLVLLVVSAALALLAPPADLETEVSLRPVLGLVFMAVCYFGTYLLLVALVSFPFERYFISMAIFLPAVLCGVLFELWRVRLWPVLAGS